MNRRPFKFRAWDHHNKVMFSHEQLLHNKFCLVLEDNKVYSMPLIQYLFEYHGEDGQKNFTIQQFTGLTDKYGRDIYEGDILKFSLAFAFSGEYNEFVEVKWDNKSGRWIVPMVTINYFNSSYVGVVGNIFDDPDLLQLCSKN